MNNNIVWRSIKCIEWVRTTQKCYVCQSSLSPYDESIAENKKTKPKFHDQYITALCNKCCEGLDRNERMFTSGYNLSKDEWEDHSIGLLSEYLEKVLNVNPRWVQIKALQMSIEENEVREVFNTARGRTETPNESTATT